MTTTQQVKISKSNYDLRIIPILLAILRIGICFWPQIGYLHPDEFFQSPESVGERYLNAKITRVWEFTTDKPIRTMLFAQPLNSFAFMIAKSIQVKPSAYLLLVLPRLIYTLTSFVIDFCLYKLCQCYSSKGLPYLPVSIIFQSSFMCLGCLTRTFSNTVETIFFALLLVVVCQTIKPRFRIVFVTQGRRSPIHERVKGSKQLTSSIPLGIIIALGTFNRPTFPAFAIVPCIYWFLESIKRNSYEARLTLQRVLVPLGISALVTAVLISAYDTFYYKGPLYFQELWYLFAQLRFHDMAVHIKENWVLTPYNFIAFNSNFDNLVQFGIHKPYTHMFINIPFAFNLLGILFLLELCKLILSSGLRRLLINNHRLYSLMLLTALISTLLLSSIPHQEFRFSLPLIVPFTYIFTSKIYASNKLLTLWFILNLSLLYFYSCVHQSGITRAILDLDPILKPYSSNEVNDEPKLSIVAFRCYLVPTYQWNVPSNDNKINFYLQETHQSFNASLEAKINQILEQETFQSPKIHQLYIMLHRLYERDLISYLHERFNSTSIQVLNHYSPHFSGEDLEESVNHIRQKGIAAWKTAFGFSLLKVNFSE